MKTIIYNFLYFFSAIRRCFLPMAFLTINIVIVWVILTTSQVQDLLFQINENHKGKGFLPDWGIMIYTFLWMIFSYASSNFSLRYSTIYTATTHKKIVFFANLMLQKISFVIVVIQSILLLSVYLQIQAYWLLFETLAVVVIVIIFLLMVQKKRMLPLIMPENEKIREFFNFKWFQKLLFEKGRFVQIVIIILVLSIHLFIIACFLLLIFGVSWSRYFNPLSIILIAASFWIFPALFLSILAGRYRFPAYSTFVIYVWIISGYNNNHEIQQFDNSAISKRKTDVAYINHWLGNLIAEEDKIHGNSENSIPIYIFAGEGGGIRAAYWSGNLLAKLDSLDNRLYRRTVALTGVSGSSIGFLFYHSMKEQKVDDIQTKIKKLSQQDFLSSLLVGFFFSDMWQRFIPIKIPKADRARYLENSFAKNYEEITNNNLSEVKLLEEATQSNGNSPILLFNTTEVETGKKAIISNVKLSDRYFFDVVDVLEFAQKDMLKVSSATSSARFPIVTPAGLVKEDKYSSSSLVDGGYFENTGLHSAYQLLKLIQNEVAVEYRERIRIKIIFLRNGVGDTQTDVKQSKVGRKYEWSPLLAFFNAWDRKSVPIEYDSRAIIPDAYYQPFRAEFYTFALNRKGENEGIPLGWNLSSNSVNKIEKSLADSLMSFSMKLK